MTDLGRSGFSGDIQEDGSHKPVLLRESIESLNIKPDGVYADMTLGRGGHSAAIAERLDTGMLLCFDRDQDAIDEAAEGLPYSAESGADKKRLQGSGAEAR